MDKLKDATFVLIQLIIIGCFIWAVIATQTQIKNDLDRTKRIEQKLDTLIERSQ